MKEQNLLSMRTHARQLAEIHGVRLIETDQLQWHEAFALRGIRCAFVPPIIDPIVYAVALHELGHLAAPHEAGKILEEEKAWAWGRRHAVFWTPEMEAQATASLATYYEHDEETFSDQRERLGWILALPEDDEEIVHDD